MKRYLTFLGLSSLIKFNCNHSCIKVLEAIAMAESSDKPFTVNQAMALDSIASPATMHRRLDMLLDAGYITHVYKEKNRRTKYIVTTERSKTYFKALEHCLVLSLGD